MKSRIDIVESWLDKKLITLAVTCLLLLSGMMVIFSGATEAASPENEVDVEEETNGVKGSKERDTSKVETSANEIKADGGSEWLTEPVDTNGDTGIEPDLAVDNNGVPYIAYREDDYDLIWAKWDGSSWVRHKIMSGNPDNEISLAIDSNNRPHIAYDSVGNDLKYGWLDSDSNWHWTTVVDSDDNPYDIYVDRDVSLALDSEDDPHIAYYDKNLGTQPGAIRHAVRDGQNWDRYNAILGGYHPDLSIAIDDHDSSIVSFYDGGENSLNVWYGHGDYIDYGVSEDGGRYNSIAVNSEGYARISYYDYFHDAYSELEIAKQGPDGWTNSIIDYGEGIGTLTSISLDEEDDPHISYLNEGNYSLKYARKETDFEKETVTDNNEVLYTSIALGKNGHPRIAYKDSTYGNLMYAVEGVPSKPTYLWVAGGDDKVDLWWGEPEDPGGRDIDKYNIYRGETSGGESLLTSVDSTTTTYTDNDVTPGNKYYYYVTAENPIGKSPQSMEGNATPSTDNQPPSKPKVSYPDDGDFLEEGQISTALMVDVRDPDGDSMDVTFKDFFGNTIGTDSDVPSGDIASMTYDSLAANWTYYWYAIANDGINTTTSDWFHFTTDDPYEIDKDNDGPNSAYGIGNDEETWLSDLEGKGRQADQDWYVIDVTQNYQHVHAKAKFTHSDGDIELRLYNSSGLPVASSDTWTDDEDIHYKVKSSGTYYLRVSGQHKGNLYDLWWDDKDTPLPPEDPKPADGGKADTSPKLNVTVYDGSADTMDVRFFDASDDSLINSVADVESGSTAEVEWTGLEERKTYEWYATASDASATVRSPTWSFTTNGVPYEPDNLSPEDGAIGVSLNPTLSAHVSDPDGDSMDVQFANDDTGTVMGYDWDVENDTTSAVTAEDLSPGTTYNWYAHADDGYDWNMSSIHSFTTDDAYEENDYMSSAYDISTNETEWLSTINGTGIQADDDWYRIYVNDGYEHVIADCTFDDSQGDIDLALYNSEGTQLANSISTDDNESIDYYVESSGFYYLKLSWGDQGNAYDLRWDDKAGTPDKPTNPDPGDGVKIANTTVQTLSVDISDPDGDAMDVSFYDASDDSQIDSTQNDVPDGGTASVDWTGLSSGQTYDWYAEAYDGTHTNQSNTWSFTVNTPPEKVTSTGTPSDGENGVGTSPKLEVTVNDLDGDLMNVDFHNASDGSTIGTDTGVSDGETASVTWSGLANDHSYDWYVVVYDSWNATQSNTWSFNTAASNVEPDKPIDPSPSDGSSGVSTSPTLEVDVSDPDGDTMSVSFHDASDDSQIGTTQTGISDGGTASVTWSGLSGSTTYNWYGIADDGSLTNQSATWSFTTASGNVAPDAPTDPTPEDGVENVITSPSLEVNVSDPDGDSMDVTFYDDSDDSEIGTDTNIADGGTASVTWSGLSNGTTYQWYAIANDGSSTNQSSTWSFTTNYPPNAPENPSPEDGADGISLSPTISVDVSDPDGDTMDVSFYDSSDDSQIGTTQTDTPDGGTASVTWSGLSGGTTYEWYVFIDDNTNHTRSASWSFTTNHPPNAPTDEIPENGAVGVSTSPTLSVNVSDPDKQDLDVTFFNASDDSVIGSENNVPSGETAATSLSGLSPNTEYTWYVEVSDGIDTIQSSTWSATTDDLYEENDNLSEAHDLSLNETEWLNSVDGKGSQADDDWYEIYVDPSTKNLKVNLTFTHAEGDLDLRLYNNSGTWITGSYSTTDDEALDYMVSSEGTYYIRVYGSNAGNFYDLYWNDTAKTDDAYEENDARSEAYDLSSAEDTWLSDISGNGIQLDDDWYEIKASSLERLIKVNLTFVHADGDLDLSLYDSSGNSLTTSWSSTDNEEISYEVSSSGTYYLRVWGYYGDTGNSYDLWWENAYTGIAGLANSAWPMFQADSNHTGRSPYDTSHIDGTEKWTFSTGGSVHSSPVIGPDGTIYVTSRDNKLYAVEPNGTKRWDFEAGDDLTSTPAVGSNGTVYVGSWDHNVYAVNASTGNQQWSFSTGDNVTSSPAIGSDGTIYVCSRDDKVYAIYPNGTEKGNVTLGQWGSSPAIGNQGNIYVGSRDSNLYAIDSSDGSINWTFSTGSYISSPPSIGSDGTIYVGSGDNKIYAVNPNGTERWNFSTGDGVFSSPAIDSDGNIYFTSYDNKTYALNPNGTERWNFTTGDIIDSSPAIGADGSIYFGSWDDKIYALNQNGDEKWNISTGGSVLSSPAIGSDGTVYIGSGDDNLYAIGGSPLAPQNLQASSGDHSVSLSWDPPSDKGGSSLNEYRIYRGTSSGSLGYHDSVGGGTTAYTDSGLTNGQTYYYEVSAVNSDAEGERSLEESATPLTTPYAPGNIQVTAGDEVVNLTWNTPSDDGGASITGYNIYRGTSSDALSLYDSVGGSILAYDDTAVTPGQVYYYQVSAVNSEGEGDKTVEKRTAPYSLPSAPQNLQASPGDSSVDLAWDPPSDNGSSSLTGYNIYRGTSSGNLGYHDSVDASTTSYTDSGLTNGQTYYYKVSAVNSAGEGDNSSETSATSMTTPSTPQNLQAGAGDKTVDLTWDAPAQNGGSSIITYRIYRGTSSGNLGYHDSVNGSTTSYTDSGLTNSQTYYYKVSAVNSAGEGDNSSETSATPESPNTPPSAPFDPNPQDGATNISTNPELSVTVTDPDGDSMDVIFYDASNGSILGTVTSVDDGANATLNLSGLSPGTTYEWYAVANDSQAENQSATWSFTIADDQPPEAGDPTPEDGATNVSFTPPPVLNVVVTDPDTDTLDVTFYDAADHSVINTISNVSSGGTAAVSWSGLSPGTTYEWYVEVSDGHTTTMSDTWSFTTVSSNRAPEAPNDPSPVDDETNVTTDPDLSVTVSDPDGDTLNVTFYDASDDSEIDTVTGVTDGSTAEITWSGLSNGMTYEWYAVADDGSATNQSDTWSFTTRSEENAPPDAPTNPSPSDGATGIGTEPDLSVTVSDPDGDTLDVTFYNASNDSVIGVDENVTDGGTASVIWSGLSEGTTYEWYAVADDGALTNQSTTWSFTTSSEENTAPDEPTNPWPLDEESDVRTSPTLSVDVSDLDGDSMNVTFYDASDDSVIGNDTGVASGETATITWSELSSGTTYEWYAVADDGSLTNESAVWSFTTSVSGNYGVSLSGPSDQETSEDEITLQFTIENKGDQNDTYDLSVDSSWSVSLETESIQIESGESESVNVTLSIPSNASDGDTADITFTVTSQNDDSISVSDTVQIEYDDEEEDEEEGLLEDLSEYWWAILILVIIIVLLIGYMASRGTTEEPLEEGEEESFEEEEEELFGEEETMEGETMEEEEPALGEEMDDLDLEEESE